MTITTYIIVADYNNNTLLLNALQDDANSDVQVPVASILPCSGNLSFVFKDPAVRLFSRSCEPLVSNSCSRNRSYT